MGNVNDDDWYGADNRKQKAEKKSKNRSFGLKYKSRGSKKSITLTPKSFKHASHPHDPSVSFDIRDYIILSKCIMF